MSDPRYLKKLPESTRYTGDAGEGEIEIIDKREAPKIRAKTGILIEDKLQFFVRDAVKAPRNWPPRRKVRWDLGD